MNRLVCVRCECRLVVVKVGARVLEMMGDPQTEQEPYRLWGCDIWQCPHCGIEVCGSFGDRPLAEHWEPDFAILIETELIHDYERSGPWTPSWRG